MTLIYLLLFLLAGHTSRANEPQLAKKPQDGLLTPDYGIVTQEDLAVDAWSGNPRPFDPKEDSHGYNRWQCLPVRDVTPRVRTWRDSDPMGYADVIVTMCDLEVWAKRDGVPHVYVGRRAKQVGYCQWFMSNWKKLTRGQKTICLNGEYGGLFDSGDPKSKPVKLWTWNKVKSKKGCFSYFGKECDLSYWKEQGFPGPRR